MSVFEPARWAKSVPLLLRGNGTPDTTAHHVLLVMATFADPDGTNIRPSVATLTKDAHFIKQRTTTDALARLEVAGLIVRTGELTGGTVVWKLNYEHVGVSRVDVAGSPAEFDGRRERELAAQAERNRRYRQRQRDAAEGRHVTPPSGVTNASVGRHVTPLTPSHPQVTPATPALDQPLTSPLDLQTWGTLPLDPLRTDAPQAACRTDLEPAAEQSKTTSTEVDRESPVPPRDPSKCATHPLLAAGVDSEGNPRCAICRRAKRTAAA